MASSSCMIWSSSMPQPHLMPLWLSVTLSPDTSCFPWSFLQACSHLGGLEEVSDRTSVPFHEWNQQERRHRNQALKKQNISIIPENVGLENRLRYTALIKLSGSQQFLEEIQGLRQMCFIFTYFRPLFYFLMIAETSEYFV